MRSRIECSDILEGHGWKSEIWISWNDKSIWMMTSGWDRKFTTILIEYGEWHGCREICIWLRLICWCKRLNHCLKEKESIKVRYHDFRIEQTRRDRLWLFVTLVLRTTGSWMRAFPTDWMVLFASDCTEMVSNDMNTDDVLIVRFWPRLRWIFKAEVNNEVVSLLRAVICSAICFW